MKPTWLLLNHRPPIPVVARSEKTRVSVTSRRSNLKPASPAKAGAQNRHAVRYVILAHAGIHLCISRRWTLDCAREAEGCDIATSQSQSCILIYQHQLANLGRGAGNLNRPVVEAAYGSLGVASYDIPVIMCVIRVIR